ncbi:unknown protein [Microcystis aeruginosa NIES-843]|uniref:Uncharacterized protein n=1 Tax=Microcystis aeruginosa (strain NIES-843 / IAM M-2473) TaxID=449447 RepID=B0JKZ2_MICAN|nr:unknown protein [Microcystis aeruginosa NIES-843]
MKKLPENKAVTFQSLIGFKINWNEILISAAISLALFQSLIGFKINWNLVRTVSMCFMSMFQSLIGFKINWNFISSYSSTEYKKVSIPNRV